MTEFEKILAEEANINDYSLENDFDNNEIEQLLDAGIIEAMDIKQSRASDLLIDGVIDYEQYPFDEFSVFEQLRQLEHNIISLDDFIKQADFDAFDDEEKAHFKSIAEERGIDFVPQNALEQAIYDHNSEMVIYTIAENNMLTALTSVSNLESECFSDEVIFSVLFNAVTEKQLHTIADGSFYAAERLRKLVDEALAPLPQDPSAAEKQLIKAIVFHDNNEIIRLIREEKAQFNGFAPELLTMLPELSKEAVLTFLKDGLSAKLKAIVWRIFLNETEEPDLLKDFSYAERCKYANLMIKILAGKSVSVVEPWYPEDPEQGLPTEVFGQGKSDPFSTCWQSPASSSGVTGCSEISSRST